MQQMPTIPQPNSPMETSPISPDVPPLPSSRDTWKGVLSTLILLILAPVLAWAMITFVFQSYEVDGPSMEHTLQNQDRLVVLKLQRTWARITRKPYIPARGDIVIFEHADIKEFGSNQKRQLIKRVIGIPGDRVVVQKGIITVYNKERPEGFSPESEFDHINYVPTSTGNDIDVTIKPGEVFACGDNRPNSLDSRSFGPIKADSIIGKLAIRLLPINKLDIY